MPPVGEQSGLRAPLRLGVAMIHGPLPRVVAGQHRMVLGAHPRQALLEDRLPVGQVRHDFADGEAVGVGAEVRLRLGQAVQQSVEERRACFQGAEQVVPGVRAFRQRGPAS